MSKEPDVGVCGALRSSQRRSSWSGTKNSATDPLRVRESATCFQASESFEIKKKTRKDGMAEEEEEAEGDAEIAEENEGEPLFEASTETMGLSS